MTGADLLAEYGARWVMHLIALCSPRVPHEHKGVPCEHPGKVPIRPEWQRLPDRRCLRGVSPEWLAAEAANHLERGNIGLAVPRDCLGLDADSPKAAARLSQACPDAPLQDAFIRGSGLYRLHPTSFP